MIYFLKNLRQEKKLKQNDVAKILGVSKDYMCMLENGRRQPGTELIFKISQLYNLKAEEIFLATRRTQNTHTEGKKTNCT